MHNVIITDKLYKENFKNQAKTTLLTNSSDKKPRTSSKSTEKTVHKNCVIADKVVYENSLPPVDYTRFRNYGYTLTTCQV
jgi:hypothetical protein